MILSMYNQTIIFLLTILLGMFVGFIYDIFRIIRKTFYHNDIFINLEDILYWIISSFIVFNVMLNINYGEIRFYSILGVFLGMILYFITISILIMKILNILVDILGKILKIVIDILIIPVKIIIKIIIKIIEPIKLILNKWKKYVKFKKKDFITEFKIMKKKV